MSKPAAPSGTVRLALGILWDWPHAILHLLYRTTAVLADVIMVVSLAGIVIVTMTVVISRTGVYTFVGAEELTGLFLVWGVYAYMGRSYRSSAFVRMRAVYAQVPYGARWVIELFERIVALLFAAFLGYQGFVWAEFQYSIGRTSFTSLALPAWTLVAALPAGCVLLALATITRSLHEDARDPQPGADETL
jgi:TRAP-type C4-dicarboxylate transport system permease small subunit